MHMAWPETGVKILNEPVKIEKLKPYPPSSAIAVGESDRRWNFMKLLFHELTPKKLSVRHAELQLRIAKICVARVP